MTRAFRWLRAIVARRARARSAAVSDRAVLSLRRSGLDHHAVALDDRPARRAHRRAARPHGAERCRARSSRPRTAASAPITGSTGAGCARRSTRPTTSPRCAAARPSPSRSPRTCSSGRGAATCARRWKCRWRSGSTWSCPSAACWRSISTSPNGGRTAQFGAEAGARYAFDKSARQLTAREAALMAAVLPGPRAAQRAPALGQCAPAGGDLRSPRGPVRGADELHRRRPQAPESAVVQAA